MDVWFSGCSLHVLEAYITDGKGKIYGWSLFFISICLRYIKPTILCKSPKNEAELAYSMFHLFSSLFRFGGLTRHSWTRFQPHFVRWAFIDCEIRNLLADRFYEKRPSVILKKIHFNAQNVLGVVCT